MKKSEVEIINSSKYIFGFICKKLPTSIKRRNYKMQNSIKVNDNMGNIKPTKILRE